MRLFGREPAWWITNVLQPGLLLVLLVLLVAPFTTAVTAALSALVTVVCGALLAFAVSAEKGLPLVAGVAQGIFALFFAAGTPVTENWQQLILGAVALFVGAYTRREVSAPVDLAGYRVSKQQATDFTANRAA